MSYAFYKIVHVAAALAIFTALGGACFQAMQGTGRDAQAGRGLIRGVHGVALFASLVAGFGLLARLGMATGWPGWVWGKLVLWLILGGVLALPYRRPQWAGGLLLTLLLLGLAATWLAVAKPF